MKWFSTLYLLSADKGGISALRLAKIVGARWRTAYKIAESLARGHGGGRTPVLMGIEALDSLAKAQILYFAQRRLQPDAVGHPDVFVSLSGLAVQATRIAKITPPSEAEQRLPWVHIVITNINRFPLGAFHGAVRPHPLQEYVDEFVYRFNRRYWEQQIPNRLLALCAGTTGPALCGTSAYNSPMFADFFKCATSTRQPPSTCIRSATQTGLSTGSTKRRVNGWVKRCKAPSMGPNGAPA